MAVSWPWAVATPWPAPLATGAQRWPQRWSGRPLRRPVSPPNWSRDEECRPRSIDRDGAPRAAAPGFGPATKIWPGPEPWPTSERPDRSVGRGHQPDDALQIVQRTELDNDLAL